MRALLLPLLALAACRPYTSPSWEGTGVGGTSQPLAAGGAVAIIGGLGEALDVVSTDASVARGIYSESSERTGNDGPGAMVITTRKITVTSGVAGACDLVLRSAGTMNEVARAHITVEDVAMIDAGGPQAVFINDAVALDVRRLDGAGAALLGNGGLTCSASGPVMLDFDCVRLYTTAARGNASVVLGSGGASATVPLTVVDPSAVRAITLERLATPDTTTTDVRVTAMTDAGPAIGGTFQCTLEGDDPYDLVFDAPPAVGPGQILHLLSPPKGAHLLTCTLGAVSASTTLQL